MEGTPIRLLDLSGDPSQMGARHGTAFAGEIQRYARDRMGLSKAGTDLGDDDLLALAERCLPAHRRYAPGLYEEMESLAAGAGISAAEAVIVGGYTDFIDVVRAHSGTGSVVEECTSAIVPDHAAAGAGFLAQTWDMHASATEHVVMLRLAPATGPGALVFSTVGCVGQIGLNDAGIAVGINNLTAGDGRPGVTWPFVVRKALQQTDIEAAIACVLEADLAGGHNFLFFDAEGNGAEIEAMPTAHHVRRLGQDPLVHTNHCLASATRAVEAPRPADLQESSESRLRDGAQLLDLRPIDEEALMAMTRDERSICRHPSPPWDYATCGAAIMQPRTGRLWACWGVPSDNAFELFSLEMSPL